MTMTYDTIIVGGGSAGCVLARRLSDEPTHRVLVCEAGRDLVEGDMPDDIRASYPGTAYINQDYLWQGLTVRSIGGAAGSNHAPTTGIDRPYAQARILGGGSSINGQMANWGVPGDYDGWAAAGASGWDWANVAPFFRRIERDLDFATPEHGQHGPIAVRRIFPDRWNPHTRAAAAAFGELGYAYLEDQNGDFGDGCFPLVHSNLDETRQSAATTYLDAATRRRRNLTVMTHAQVTGLTMAGARCTGVTVGAGDAARRIAARRVVLSAGAIHSPAILMRAGIGPGAHLLARGIAPVVDLPGVGQGLMDHPQVAMGAYMRRSARMDGSTGRHVLLGLRYSSGLGEAPPGDMFAVCLSRTAWHDVGAQLGSLVVWINKTFSNAGEIRLASADWRDEPAVDFRLLSDGRDMDRLVQGLRLMGAAHLTQAMQEVTSEPFPASYTDRARQVGALTLRNRWLTAAMARLLDGPAPLRRALLKRFVMAGHDFSSVMTDDAAARAFVRESVSGMWHASCSCRMGAADDPMAVVDPKGRVRNVDGLWIADASVFPVIPSANTNFPAMMVAEKIASHMRIDP